MRPQRPVECAAGQLLVKQSTISGGVPLYRVRLSWARAEVASGFTPAEAQEQLRTLIEDAHQAIRILDELSRAHPGTASQNDEGSASTPSCRDVTYIATGLTEFDVIDQRRGDGRGTVPR